MVYLDVSSLLMEVKTSNYFLFEIFSDFVKRFHEDYVSWLFASQCCYITMKCLYYGPSSCGFFNTFSCRKSSVCKILYAY